MMAAKSTSLFETFPKRVDKARTRAEKLIGSAWKQAVEALPTQPRKALKDATAQIEKVTVAVQKRQARALKDVTAQIGQVTAAVQKRQKRVLKEVTARRDRLVATVEKQAVAVVKPIVARLDVASRTDVDRLSKRVSQLEKRVGSKAKHAVAA